MEILDWRISPDQYSCWDVQVSTVDESWAVSRRPRSNDARPECPPWGDGHAVFQNIYGGWEESWQASEPVSCGYRDMPPAVGRDLALDGVPLCRKARTYLPCIGDRRGTWQEPRQRPRRCNTLGRLDSFAGSVNLRRLNWRHWGDWFATATGIERGFKLPLRRIPVRVRAYRPREDCFGDRIYTRLRATSRYGSTIVRFSRSELLGGNGCWEF